MDGLCYRKETWRELLEALSPSPSTRLRRWKVGSYSGPEFCLRGLGGRVWVLRKGRIEACEWKGQCELAMVLVSVLGIACDLLYIF